MTDETHEPSQFEAGPTPEPERPQGSQPGGPGSTGIAWGAILLLLGIALVVVFAVQNTDVVPVKFLWMEGQFSLAIVILVTVGVIIVLTELIGLSYRGRRRRRHEEREELRKYRGA
ncbi:MAG: lipopolysaccharide assembly protein LapA domain-containing protein [Acidimicrobiia bacterium]